MNNFFLKIFDFFQTRKTLLWVLLAAIIAALAFSALRISFVEDISSFLPNNANNRRVNEAFQKIGAANKIMVRFAMCDERHATNQESQFEILTEAATRFAEILSENDSLNHIKELIYEVDNEKIKEVTDFITKNLPYFLEEEDYKRIDSLLQPQAIEKQLKAGKELLMSPMGGFVRNVILNDPLLFSKNALKNLEVFKQNENFNTDDGFIFNERGECLVIISSNYPVSETNNNKLLANEIYKAANQTVEEFGGEIKIVPFGATLISITNANQIRNDSLFAVSIALVLILALLFYFFRSFKSLFFIAASIAFGALFSFGVIVIFKSTVSVIAIGMSSILFGIAINYPLHFLSYFRHELRDMRQAICDRRQATGNEEQSQIANRKSQIENQESQIVKNTIKVIVNPLLIGNITTVGAFLSLLFISSDAMKDLGMFSSFLLVGTIGFVLVFLPHLASPNPSKGGGQAPAPLGRAGEGHIFGKLAEFSPEKNKFVVLVFLIFTVVLFFFSFGTKFETNLHAINYMTAEQRAEINTLIEQNADKGKTLYMVAEGRSFDEALLYNNTAAYPIAQNLLKDSLIQSFSGIGRFFQPYQTAADKLGVWKEFWKTRKDTFISNFETVAQQQGFNTGVFNNFTAILNNDFDEQWLNDYCYNNKLESLAENYISKGDNNLVYTMLQVSPERVEEVKNRINQALNDDSIFIFDDSSIAEKMVNALSDDFNYVLYICGFIVFAFLFFSFGRIELAILTFIPLTVAWVWILGLMNIFGFKFNIVNIILATFIFGQGDDYTILVTEGLIYEYTYRKKMLAKFKNSIILSTGILFIGIGMLIFAKHPAMRSLAEVTIVGMISVVLCAFLFPPLIFRFLTTKKGKPREVPWTLKRWIRGVYSFAVFLLGCFVITVYGLFLFGFRRSGVRRATCDVRQEENDKNSRKSQIENRKLRFHRLLQWAANFVIRRVPGTKFRYENLSGETFDKPAVIISNHQSIFDLMCLMMLTPKLIILTNNWVWNSPFFGKMIRYAEFYPVSKGIENSIAQLAGAVQRGYSIVIFPEGTRSPDNSILRFHRGAFYLAEKLQLDIIPVFLHGVGHVLPKTDFMLREGLMTVQVHERITPTDSRFAADYVTRSKQVRRYYRETFAEISRKIETPDYFKSFVLHNYMYKGMEVWRGVKKEMCDLRHAICDMRCATCNMRHATCNMRHATCDFANRTSQIENQESHIAHRTSQILIKNNGYGTYSFMYALAHKDTQVIAIDDDEDKVAIARNCAGIPPNLTIYHTSEICDVRCATCDIAHQESQITNQTSQIS